VMAVLAAVMAGLGGATTGLRWVPVLDRGSTPAEALAGTAVVHVAVATASATVAVSEPFMPFVPRLGRCEPTVEGTGVFRFFVFSAATGAGLGVAVVLDVVLDRPFAATAAAADLLCSAICLS